MDNKISLNHGNGGIHTDELIKNIFHKYFDNSILNECSDSAVIPEINNEICFTTDSFVVKPIFFPGGDIGKIAMCGTINDLIVSGATPFYVSAAFIIEEGFDMSELEKIVISMSNISKVTNVLIVTGDTKVVEKGSADGIYINTSGIGRKINNYKNKEVCQSDKIIVTGGVGEHGTSIALSRYNINAKTEILSDCMPLDKLLPIVEKYGDSIKFMRDPTRGGIATTLNEIASHYNVGIEVDEENIPIKDHVKGVCSILGLDPLYLACEGRMVIVAEENVATDILNDILKIEKCEDAAIIGSILCDKYANTVIMNTSIGGKKYVEPLYEDSLPRIC